MQTNSNISLDLGFSASERLKSRKAIGELFAGSPSAKAYPLRLVYRLVPRAAEQDAPAKMGFVASKRNFKRAPDRNHVKRRMRESHRLSKSKLYAWLEEHDQYMEGMLIFTGRDLPTQKEITYAWRKLLRRLDPDFFK
ncbi:MAG: ribonuclease P protein component [Saprospiraceae bacterium]